MTDYFNMRFSTDELRSISVLGLAHVGDAVYDLLVRSWLCSRGRKTSRDLHRETVSLVNAPAQAKAAERIMDALSEEEQTAFRRGRNAKVNSIPKNADIAEYHAATGLETLFGYLYLKGERNRLSELFGQIVEE